MPTPSVPVNPPNRRTLKMVISTIFYVALGLFLLQYLRSINLAQLADVHFAWGYIFVATIFGLGFRLWGAYIWMVLLAELGAQTAGSQVQLIYVYAKSWLGRYLPGAATWMVGKVYFASRLGISKNKLAISSLLEGALQVTVVLALAFALLIFDSRLDVVSTNFKIIMIIVLAACLIVLIPAVFNGVVALAYKLVRRKTLAVEHRASGRTIIKGIGLYAVGSVLSGLSLFFIAKAVYPDLPFDSLLYVMGVSNLAGALSMLAIFAPSGLGVREGIQLVLLSVIMPTEAALVITVATRLWSIGVDFIFFGVGKALVAGKQRSV